jgi:hypothetical protein
MLLRLTDSIPAEQRVQQGIATSTIDTTTGR